MQRLDQAVDVLEQLVTSPLRLQQSWAVRVREQLAAVCEALSEERTGTSDSWLSARAGHLHRERNRLIARVSVLAGMVSDSTDIEPLRQALLRVAQDVQHHAQRVSDLMYDAVAMEVGGSE